MQEMKRSSKYEENSKDADISKKKIKRKMSVKTVLMNIIIFKQFH